MGFLHFRLRFVSRFYVLCLSPGHFNNFQLISLRFSEFSFCFPLLSAFIFIFLTNSWKCHFIDLLTFNFIFTANFPKKLFLFIYFLACALWITEHNFGAHCSNHKRKRHKMQFSMRENLLTLGKLFARPRSVGFQLPLTRNVLAHKNVL